MIDFVLAKWMAIAIAYGIIYAVYVIYALFALRFERQAQDRRVTDDDFMRCWAKPSLAQSCCHTA